MTDRLDEIEQAMFQDPTFGTSESRVYGSLGWLITEVKELRAQVSELKNSLIVAQQTIDALTNRPKNA